MIFYNFIWYLPKYTFNRLLIKYKTFYIKIFKKKKKKWCCLFHIFYAAPIDDSSLFFLRWKNSPFLPRKQWSRYFPNNQYCFCFYFLNFNCILLSIDFIKATKLSHFFVTLIFVFIFPFLHKSEENEILLFVSVYNPTGYGLELQLPGVCVRRGWHRLRHPRRHWDGAGDQYKG